MISRVWRGWTTHANADAYEELRRSEVLPGIHRVNGFKGTQVLRRDASHDVNKNEVSQKDEAEFVTITLFDSLEAVKEFAGEDYEVR